MANIEILNISFKSLKAEIKSLQEEMLNLNKESDEYKKKASECAEKQLKLKEVMNDSKKGFAENSEETKNLEGSYNALSKELSKLRKEWKSTNDEAKRQEIGAQMVKINDQLKVLDESVGVYSRNVGNYANSFKTALDGIGLSGTKLGATFQTLGAMADGAKNSSIGFKGALDLIAKHPILTIVGLLVTIFLKLKDSISQNEELSNKLAKAMSALNPIFNAITNAVDFLASKLVDLISWTMGKVPEVIKFSAKVTETIGDGIAAIVKAITFLPSIFNKVFSSISETVFKGLTYMGDGIAKFLKGVGLDSLGEKLTSSLKAISTTVSKAFEISGNILESASDKVKEFFATSAKGQIELANAMQKSQAARQAAIDLEQRLRKEEALTEASKVKQAKLSEQIAQTSDPAERIKYQKQLRAEIETTGKRQVQLAKEQYEQAKYYASLAPNSKADNEQLAQLEANVLKTEAAYTIMMASVDKQMTRNEKTLTKTAKAEQAQRLKDLDEYVKSANETISQIGSEATDELNKLNSEKELMASNGQLTPEQQKNFEDERYKIVSESIQKQKDKYYELFDSKKLTAEQELALRSKYNSLLYQEQIEANNHQKTLNEIWLNDRKKTYEQDAKNRKATEASDNTKATMEYTVDYVADSEKYLSGEITYEEYEQRITELQEQYAEQRLLSQIEADNKQLDALQDYYDDVLEKMGATSDEAVAIEAQLAAARAKVDENSSKLAIYNVDKELKQKKTATAQKEKLQKNELNAYKSFSSGMQALMGENSKAAKALAISDAIVNTWQGAAAVLKEGPAAYGGGIFGTALMYANMAGVIASGMANVANITSESTSGGGVSAPSISYSALNQTPLLNEVTDMQNAQVLSSTQNDNRVYILESDIQSSNARVNVREVSSEF